MSRHLNREAMLKELSLFNQEDTSDESSDDSSLGEDGDAVEGSGGVGAGGGEQQDGGDGDHRRGSRPDDPLQVCPRPPQQDEHTSTRENSYGIGKQTFFYISSTFRLKN